MVKFDTLFFFVLSEFSLFTDSVEHENNTNIIVIIVIFFKYLNLLAKSALFLILS